MKARTYRKMLASIRTLVEQRDEARRELALLPAYRAALAEAERQVVAVTLANGRLTRKLIDRDV